MNFLLLAKQTRREDKWWTKQGLQLVRDFNDPQGVSFCVSPSQIVRFIFSWEGFTEIGWGGKESLGSKQKMKEL